MDRDNIINITDHRNVTKKSKSNRRKVTRKKKNIWLSFLKWVIATIGGKRSIMGTYPM